MENKDNGLSAFEGFMLFSGMFFWIVIVIGLILVILMALVRMAIN